MNPLTGFDDMDDEEDVDFEADLDADIDEDIVEEFEEDDDELNDDEEVMEESDEDSSVAENGLMVERDGGQIYDVSLPDQHAYLGDDMEELHGRVVLENDIDITIPILSLPGVILVPGQVLPLQVELPSMVSMIKAIVSKDRTFGLCTNLDKKTIGTTAEVRSISEDTGFGLPVLRVKAEGRQRFTVDEAWRQADGLRMAKVRICPENDLPHPGKQDYGFCSRGCSRNAKLLGVMTSHPSWVYSMYDPMILMDRIEKHLDHWAASSIKSQTHTQTESDDQDIVLTRTITTVVRNDNRLSTGRGNVQRSSNHYLNHQQPEVSLTDQAQQPVHPVQTSDVVEPEIDSSLERPSLLGEEFPASDEDIVEDDEDEEDDDWETKGAPKTPLAYSYWVAKNLPLEDSQRLELLCIKSPIQRLRCELHILEKYVDLCCASCKSKICSRDDVFSMSLSGPQAAYVNPAGQIHDTLTVLQAASLTLYGRSYTEYSWFPGYAWTICHCSNCESHMGWKFTSTNKRFQPESFWGLKRTSLEPAFKKDAEDSGWNPVY